MTAEGIYIRHGIEPVAAYARLTIAAERLGRLAAFSDHEIAARDAYAIIKGICAYFTDRLLRLCLHQVPIVGIR